MSDQLPLPGHHLPTNAARQLLTQAGLEDPRTGGPISAAVALGISGGLGCGYILWQFKGELGTVLTLGFTYRWNYGKEAPANLIARLGGRPRWLETGSRAKAAAQLDEVLATGRAATAWLDQVHLGYLRQPDHLEGCFGWHATGLRPTGRPAPAARPRRPPPPRRCRPARRRAGPHRQLQEPPAGGRRAGALRLGRRRPGGCRRPHPLPLRELAVVQHSRSAQVGSPRHRRPQQEGLAQGIPERGRPGECPGVHLPQHRPRAL